ncbi:hypothetical protein [Paraburkholderia susongensis]|uniref:hypothetical protein n=1 Tax=Paraburkholderia susongensis TaxID=1515439 RepID=UPI000A1CC662|nr:hypothetical protein [Paraburkholderia susongensis]
MIALHPEKNGKGFQHNKAILTVLSRYAFHRFAGGVPQVQQVGDHQAFALLRHKLVRQQAFADAAK